VSAEDALPRRVREVVEDDGLPRSSDPNVDPDLNRDPDSDSDPDLNEETETVSLEEGRRALLTAVRADLLSEKRRQTAAGAASVGMVATLAEVADAAGRKVGRLSNNEVLSPFDRAGLGLRVSLFSRSVNDQAVFGFYDVHRTFLREIADADTERDLLLPDDERSRRLFGYAGAELVAGERVAAAADTEDSRAEADGTGAEADGTGGEADEGVAGADEDDADEEWADEFAELCERYGFEPDADPAELVAWIQDTLDEGRVTFIANRSGEDPTALRDELRDARWDLQKRIYTRRLDDEVADSDDDAPAESDSGAADRPDPEEGVLGYDWVSTADRPWSGRPLRALLYAVMTEESGLDFPDSAVDRVELINYGEPTVRSYELPLARADVTLVSDRERPGPPEKTDQHAVDFRVVGDLFDAAPAAERRVRDALEQHLNALHLLARYQSSMETGPTGVVDPSGVDTEDGRDVATDGFGPEDMTEEATRREADADLETPFERVPGALWDAMEATLLDCRRGDYEFEVHSTDQEIVGTSRSWQ
jgi:hypothetical protein